jgi:hypothetical protein
MKCLERDFWLAQTLLLLASMAVVLLLPIQSYAQESLSLEDERTKQLQELGILLPDPVSIRAAAEAEFTKSVAEQDADLLEEIASDANAYSNLVSRITDEYNDYLRENSRYDFVTEEVRKAPIVESLLALDSEFKGIRNQAYLNLGIIAMDDGREMEAFLFFNDAYRLSVFSCSEGVDNCVRYQAEQYMKSLLGVEGDSYIYWQR